MELRLDVNFVDYLILGIYFVFVLGIGFAAKRFIKTSSATETCVAWPTISSTSGSPF